MKTEPLLWLSDSRGRYIPRDFANSFANRAKAVRGVDDETWAILEAGPDHESYWDAWQDALDDAEVIDDEGQMFSVYQDGDCWLVPHEMEWDDETSWFVMPKAETQR